MHKNVISPGELHQRIAATSFGTDIVTVAVLNEQLGAISKLLTKAALTTDVIEIKAYKADMRGELADLSYHLEILLERCGYSFYALAEYGKERYVDRRSQDNIGL